MSERTMKQYPEKPDLEGYTAREAWEAGYDAARAEAVLANYSEIIRMLDLKDDDDYGEGFWT